jgi:cytochrome c553
MKKVSLILIISLAFVLQFCATSKKTKSAKSTAKTTYIANIQPLIAASCSPCHIPPKGNKKPYITYDSVRADIDEILTRIQKNPGEKGFMPARHPKLSDSTINVFVQWKKDGLPFN